MRAYAAQVCTVAQLMTSDNLRKLMAMQQVAARAAQRQAGTCGPGQGAFKHAGTGSIVGLWARRRAGARGGPARRRPVRHRPAHPAPAQRAAITCPACDETGGGPAVVAVAVVVTAAAAAAAAAAAGGVPPLMTGASGADGGCGGGVGAVF